MNGINHPRDPKNVIQNTCVFFVCLWSTYFMCVLCVFSCVCFRVPWLGWWTHITIKCTAVSAFPPSSCCYYSTFRTIFFYFNSKKWPMIPQVCVVHGTLSASAASLCRYSCKFCVKLKLALFGSLNYIVALNMLSNCVPGTSINAECARRQQPLPGVGVGVGLVSVADSSYIRTAAAVYHTPPLCLPVHPTDAVMLLNTLTAAAGMILLRSSTYVEYQRVRTKSTYVSGTITYVRVHLTTTNEYVEQQYCHTRSHGTTTVDYE